MNKNRNLVCKKFANVFVKVYVIFRNAYTFSPSSIINLPFCIFQTFSSFSTLHHHYPCLITLCVSLCVCFYPLSQCCVQLVLFPVVVCVRRVRVIHFKQKKGRSSALPAPQEHPLWPGEPSVFLIVSKGQTKSALPNSHTNSRTAGVDGYSYSSVKM